jgi:hypothetical protein
MDWWTKTLQQTAAALEAAHLSAKGESTIFMDRQLQRNTMDDIMETFLEKEQIASLE